MRRFRRTISSSVIARSQAQPQMATSKWARPASIDPQPSNWAEPEPLQPSSSSPVMAPISKWARPPMPSPVPPPAPVHATPSRVSPRPAPPHTSSLRPPALPQSFLTGPRTPPAGPTNTSGRVLAPWLTAESTPNRSASDPYRQQSQSRSAPRQQQRDAAPHQRQFQRGPLPHQREAAPHQATDITRDLPPHAGRGPVVDKRFSRNAERFSNEQAVMSLPTDHEAQEGTRSRKHHKDRHSYRDSIVAPLAKGQRQIKTEDGTGLQPKQPKIINPAKVKLLKKSQDIFIPNVITVGNLARLLGVSLGRMQRRMINAGLTDTESNQILTAEYASLLAMEFNRNPVVNDEAAFDVYPPQPHPLPSTLPIRPPVVTIMGHVDHGKTTLLDTLRSASVAKGEAGGITQHIGAFSVDVSSLSTSTPSTSQSRSSITFLDTPGHAAFSAMRARGADATDIIVLVVAADDGVMPQTKEVIELIKKDEGKVGVVVAINKVDKPDADVEAVSRALLAEGIQLETFGGDIPVVEVSGLTGQGLDILVETISAVAEVQDIRAERDGPAVGCVLESKVMKGLGPVATVLVLRGSLTASSALISGTTFARVRAITSSSGKPIKVAYPGDAVTVSGWKEVPRAGDDVLQGESEDAVKRAVANRTRKVQEERIVGEVEVINEKRKEDRARLNKEREEAEDRPSVGARNRRRTDEADDGVKELKLIVRADVSGSVEAVCGALEGIGNGKARVKIVQSDVGAPTESDVEMAKTIEGSIIAFNVSTPRSISSAAATQGVQIHDSPIIYRLMEQVRERVIELLPKIIETRVTGEANVLELFEITLKGGKGIKKVAGCKVSNGVMDKGKKVRVVRDGETVYEGTFETMKHLKSDVTEVRKGMECGLAMSKFDDARPGDLLQVYETMEKPGIL